jgi:pimeloyl-ACP methyl ester carboxylesterase
MARIYFQRLDKTGDYVMVNGEDVFIKVYGSGKPMIIIHGFLGSHLNFESIVERLSGSRKLYVVDLPGFGLSKASLQGDYSKKGYADLLVSLMKLLNISRADVLGHSMGGEVALNLAYHYPERVERLVLIDSTGYDTASYLPDFVARSEVLNYLLMRYGFQTYFLQRFLYRQGLGDLSNYSANQFGLFFSITNQVSPSFLRLFNSQDDSGTLAGSIKEIIKKTLIIWGSNDRVVTPDRGIHFDSELPDSRLVTIEGAGHSPMIEDPETVSREIIAFLSED